jgi:hypothetical protein
MQAVTTIGLDIAKCGSDAFKVSGAEVLSSTQIYDWTHSRRRQSRRKKLPFWVYWRTLKTLGAMCDPVERVPPHGAWLWRLRNNAQRKI